MSALAALWFVRSMPEGRGSQVARVGAVVVTCMAFAAQSLGAILMLGMGAGLLWVTGLVSPRRLVAGRIGDLGGAQRGLSFGRGASHTNRKGIRVRTERGEHLSCPGARMFTWRISQDQKLLKDALAQPLSGSGQWDWWRSKEIRPWGLWMLMLGQFGLRQGFYLSLATLLGPALRVAWEAPRASGWRPQGLTLLFATIAALTAFDALLNSFIYFPAVLMSGALAAGPWHPADRGVRCAHRSPTMSDWKSSFPAGTALTVNTEMNSAAWSLLAEQFRWRVPARFNIAEVCCARWARGTPAAIAIRWETERRAPVPLTYAELQADANRLSNALRRLGVRRGDRVAIVMPQRFETAVAHMAVYQLGAVAMPLSMLFGPEALEFRLQDSEAVVAIVDESAIANLCAARADCPGAAARDRRRRRGRGRATSTGTPRWPRERPRFAAVRHAGRRPRRADLHQRHHRPAQGRADPAPRADRQPHRLRLQPELVSAGRCGVLVARRLGLDRWADGRAAAHALLRPPHRRLPGPFRPERAFELMQRHA